MRFFIVRHGETAWNVEGRFQGQKNTRLNPHGLNQGDKVAAYLVNQRFEAIISSPLERALVTAQKISSATFCNKISVLDEFTEIHHGDWEGMLSSDVAERWGDILKLWHTAPHTVKMPGEGGESLRDVYERVVPAAEMIAERYKGDVCLAAHDAVIKVLLCHFVSAPLSSFWCFQIANCSLTIVEITEGKAPRVSLMGDAHFLGEGIDKPEQKGL